jgi:hypothetical protein
MKRMLVLAAVAGLAFPAAALAKGASEATIAGPGLKGGGIHLESGGGDPSPGTPLGDLTEYTGYFPATFGQEPDPMLAKRPAGTLGPKYEIEWTVPGPNGETATIRQDLYPYAEAGAMTYMRPGQTFFGSEKTHGGWFIAAEGTLKSTLVEAGLPTSPPSGGAGGSWSPLSWSLGAIAGTALVLLLGAMYVTLRRRPGPVRA